MANGAIVVMFDMKLIDDGATDLKDRSDIGWIDWSCGGVDVILDVFNFEKDSQGLHWFTLGLNTVKEVEQLANEKRWNLVDRTHYYYLSCFHFS